MKRRSILMSLSFGWIIFAVLAFVVGGSGTPQAQARQGAQQATPQPTQQVPINETATAQTRATTAPQPQPTLPPPTPVSAASNTVNPELRGFTEARLQQLHVPPGFWVDVYATGLGNPRMMVFGPDGTLYVTRRDQRDVVALADRNGDGKADSVRTIASNLPYIHGITIHDNRLYLATDTKVMRATLRGDDTLGKMETLIDDLPDGGQHPNRTLAFGPDGMLYITVGSTCNSCADSNPENATILRAMPDGSKRTIFAKGLRNTIGFDWHPGSGQLWGMDQGADARGDNQPPEELNLLQNGGNYGWPYCFGNQQPDNYQNNDPPGTTKATYCASTQAPVQMYQAHSAAIGMAFYNNAQFPAEYRGDAFVAMHGSWNRNPATGYKVVRVRFQNGWPVGFEDFLSGFLIENGAAQFGRPAGIAIAPYGSLFVSDDNNGVIYRVSWAGTKP